ncbi:hypothetical protein D9M69_728190 [compost metagenome]
MPRIFRPNSTFSCTVRQGNRAYCWNTMPQAAVTSVTGLPLTAMLPLSGAMKPAIRFSRVDLPQPEAPSSTRNSPRRTSRSTLSSTVMPP